MSDDFLPRRNPTPNAPSSLNKERASWEELRKQARLIENDIDHKLLTFMELAKANKKSTAVESQDGENRNLHAAEENIEALLDKLSNIVSTMDTIVNETEQSLINPSMLHLLQRHRDILYDYNKEFKKTQANVEAARKHQELLGGSRYEVTSFGTRQHNDEFDQLLAERDRIDNSSTMIDMTLEQAYSTQESLIQQKGILANAKQRMSSVTNQLPGINSLIGRIGRRKRRDTIILSIVIAVCLFLLLMYIF
ncbi:Golgi SNAP receptor complex member 1-like protein [Basidiobolus meristosporus CBS 931.73]|uniref:Golgi SNAP receptor complex member 1 n=1 Tax=Basidiobolus meristosporus CBS 931.73 TaxID=1314790 RepID=A0A1Y1Z7V2_9FUNG|nr:Golgi SNAP receptor complex member 1-like protein [Basidiobolus meristosporus CBS 931.73]|eukprot:ORY06077.1 Golgi SNAP receptor complex member 1-like protein [Basidiobolus meristosporus CBS 931.73]